jgi:hypothetical protein
MKFTLLMLALLAMSWAGSAQTLAIVTPALLPAGTTGVAYSQTLTASGGTPPYTWSFNSGVLPAGLSLAFTGTIAGTPTGYGTATFGITVTDSAAPTPASASGTFTLTIIPAPIVINTTSPLPSGLSGTPYSRTLSATGGVLPYSWAITAGSLPAGIILSPSGLVSGSAQSTGAFSFTATLTDALGATGSQVFSLTINFTALVISTPATLPGDLVGEAYTETIVATGGLPPYTWQITSGSLPPGLSLSSTGVISGTPTTAGTSTFTIYISYASIFYASQTFTLIVGGTPVSVATAATLPEGSTGVAYSQTLAAAGGVPPFTWSVLSGTLPPGLTLSAAGVISGMPTVGGNYAFAAQVEDSTSTTASRTFGLTVTSAGALPREGIIPQVATGGGWTTTIWLINRTAAPVQTTLVFHADDGTPLTLPFNITQAGTSSEANASTLNEVIGPNTTLVVATEAQATNVEGWADVLSNGTLSGFAVFQNGAVAEAAATLQTQIGNSISLPFDNTGGYSTGVAIANLAGAQANLTAIVWDQNGNQLASVPVTLTDLDPNGNGHDSFMLPARLPATAGIRGIVQFVGNPGTAQVPAGQLTGLGLRADTNGLFTSIPTIVP